MNTKKIMLTILSLLVILAFASNAHAVFLGCFQKGEFIDFCNPAVQDKTVATDFLFLCMTEYVEESSCYIHASFNACNGIPQNPNGGCFNGANGNATIDSQPPVLTLTTPNPDNTSVFDQSSVILDFNIDERSDVYYMDLLDGRNRFVRICNDCTGSNTKQIRFDEGINEVRFKAEDVVGNSVEMDVLFYIDSKDPRILKSNPTRGFADGNFYVEYTESNPVDLTLTYGDSNQAIDLNTCEEVRTNRFACNLNVDLSPFDGSDIQYYFTLTDIAGNSHQGKTTGISVDATNPIINSLDHIVDGRNVHFSIDVTELNFDGVDYLDLSDSRARWKSFCSRLDDLGQCSKRISFSDGPHNVIFNVTDEAGNHDSTEVSFFTDSKDPRITKTSPTRGFADGTFTADIDEANPVLSFLNYGNDATGFRSAMIDLDNDCAEARRGISCTTHVDLADYNGQEIEYWFNVTDVLDQTADSRVSTLSVDTVFPVINSLDYTIDGRRVTFRLNITEENFDSVEYIDNSASRPRFRSLCTRLTNDICEKRLTFTTGQHDLDIQVTDDAGNAVGQSVSFTI